VPQVYYFFRRRFGLRNDSPSARRGPPVQGEGDFRGENFLRGLGTPGGQKSLSPRSRVLFQVARSGPRPPGLGKRLGGGRRWLGKVGFLIPLGDGLPNAIAATSMEC
jgi:hypothetical protein